MYRIFEDLVKLYDDWYERHRAVYVSELEAIREHLPKEGTGAEIGTGTGRFGPPLGIFLGVEPSRSMALVAKERGMTVIRGVAEYLPLKGEVMDYLLITTTLCFVDDVRSTLKEAYRVLKRGGKLVLGFVDKDSFLGKYYLSMKDKNPFYRHATFYSTRDVVQLLQEENFWVEKISQTVFHLPHQVKEPEPSLSGYGKGGFVVVSAVKKT